MPGQVYKSSLGLPSRNGALHQMQIGTDYELTMARSRERKKEGQVFPAYRLKAKVWVHLNGSLSVCLSLKVEGAPALGAPVSPHHNVSLQDSPNERILHILPGVCKWQALDNHLQCTSTKKLFLFLQGSWTHLFFQQPLRKLNSSATSLGTHCMSVAKYQHQTLMSLLMALQLLATYSCTHTFTG